MAAEEHLSKRQFLYHESPAKHRESIRASGLRPSNPGTLGYGENVKTFPTGVYMSPHGQSEYSSSMRDASEFGYDRWRVDVTGLPVHADPSQSNEAHYTPEAVHPSRLRLAKKGDPDWERRKDW